MPQAKTVMLRKISAQDAKVLEQLKTSLYLPYSKILLYTLRCFPAHVETIKTLEKENRELKEKLEILADLYQQKLDIEQKLFDCFDLKNIEEKVS